ncbi:MAG: energy transducer TonB [Croceibacterium sp.]
MAYADQQMSGNKIIAIILVGLIHVAVGYALITGLAYSAMKKAIERVTTVDINEPPPPPPDTPPPPEPNKPPPPVAPPPPINISVAPPPIQVQPNIPPPAPVIRIVPPAAPPAPPPPRFSPKGASPKGNPASWATTDDYPSRALREEKEGVTRFTVTVGTDGRVTNCTVTGSSGTPELDDAACRAITRRARFAPATDGEGNPTTGSYSNSVRWQIPKN